MSASTTNDPALLYFHEIVEPTVAEFMADPADKRRGVLACLALAGMTEHYFYARPGLAAVGLPKLKMDFRDQNKALGWVADMANATRHVVRDQKSKLGYEDVQTQEMGRVGVMQAGQPIGGSEVLVETSPGVTWRLAELLEAGMAFWDDRLGLFPAQDGNP